MPQRLSYDHSQWKQHLQNIPDQFSSLRTRIQEKLSSVGDTGTGQIEMDDLNDQEYAYFHNLSTTGSQGGSDSMDSSRLVGAKGGQAQGGGEMGAQPPKPQDDAGGSRH